MPLPRRALPVPGGFAWWYADLVDDAGDGAVLIGAFGLPFLPGYRSSLNSPQPQRPLSRPSLNLALYRRGRPAGWWLHELPEGDVHWPEGSEDCSFGPSQLRSRLDGDRRTLEVDLHLPVPGSRAPLLGQLRIEGPALLPAADLQQDHPGDHSWSPLTTTSTGKIQVRHEDWSFTAEGRAYHDRNEGRLPLDQLGIQHWIWGRWGEGEEERIFYALWKPDHPEPALVQLFKVLPNGAFAQVPVVRFQERGRRRGWYGLSCPRALRFTTGEETLDVQFERIMEDGPFYLRCLLRGARGVGVAEVIAPGRVDLGWQRPLVRMRATGAAGGDSPFCPLFCGPPVGRLARLLTYWGQR